MRKSVSPSFGRTATRLMVAALLASVATGCSSDVSRFGGLFSSSGQDNMTTSSVPRRTLFGGVNPVPRGSVGNGGQMAATNGLSTAFVQQVAAVALAQIVYFATRPFMLQHLTAGAFATLFLCMGGILPSLKRLTTVQSSMVSLAVMTGINLSSMMP